MTQIVILGRRLQSDGSLHKKFIERLDGTLTLSKEISASRIIVSWGFTRKWFQSEAHVWADYLKKNGMIVPIELEESSLTTKQNLISIEKMLLDNEEMVFILFSESSKQRVTCFCKWYAPKLYNKATLMPIKWSFCLRDFLLNFLFLFLR